MTTETIHPASRSRGNRQAGEQLPGAGRPGRTARILGAPLLLASLVLAASFAVAPPPAWAASFLERAQEYYDQGELREAAVELKNALQRDPDNAEARLLLGRLHLDTGNYEGAEKELSRAWDLGLRSENVQLLLARARLEMGDYSGVLAGSNPDPDISSPLMQDLLVTRGEALLELGNTPEAAQVFQDVLKVAEHARAYTGLARIAFFNRLHSDALALIDQALSLEPENADILAVAGSLQSASGLRQEAKASFAKVLDVEPENLAAISGLARLRLQDKDYLGAKELIDDGLGLPGGRFSLFVLKSYVELALKNYNAARGLSEDLLASDSRDLTALYVSGVSAFALKDMEQAQARLTQYLSEVPGDVHAQAVLDQVNKILNSRGTARQEEAVAQAEETGYLLLDFVSTQALAAGASQTSSRSLQYLVDRSPDSPRLRAQLSMAKTRFGDFGRAEEELNRAIALDSNLEHVGEIDQATAALISGYMREREYEKAVELAEAFRERRPETSAPPTMLALVYARQGDSAKAETAVREALATNPDSPDLVGNLASVQAEIGDLDGALETLEGSLAKNPGRYRTLMQLASLSLRADNPAQARSWAEKAVAAEPRALPPQVLLARSHNRLGDYENGLKVASALLQENPRNPELLQVVGEAQFNLGQAANAVKTYETFAEVAPFSVTAHYLLARSYLNTRRGDLAMPALQRALAIDPGHYPARIAFARFTLGAGELDLAAPAIESLAAQFNDNPEVLEMEGRLALARGDNATAVQSLREAQRILAESDVDRRSVTQNLAFALWQQGERAQSQAELQNWVNRHPEDTTVRLQLATTQSELGEVDEAIDHYDVIIAAEPANWLARNELAVLLYQQGQLTEARKQAETAHEQTGEDNAAVMDTLAQILLAEGDHQSARPLLERAREMAPNQPDIALHLSQALVRSGEKAEARAVLEGILDRLGAFEGRGALEAYYDEIGSD